MVQGDAECPCRQRRGFASRRGLAGPVESHGVVCKSADRAAWKSGRFATGAAGAGLLPAHPTCGFPAASLPDLVCACACAPTPSTDLVTRTSIASIRLQREFLPAASPVVARSRRNEEATLAEAYRQVERREGEPAPDGGVAVRAQHQLDEGKNEEQCRQDDADRSPSDAEGPIRVSLHAVIVGSRLVKKRYRNAT